MINKQNSDILLSLLAAPYTNQKTLAEQTGHSLGITHRTLKKLVAEEYLDATCNLTQKATDLIVENSPKSAIILAAGFGMRMVPINAETSKAFLEIKGEALIERIIKQLHEVGIHNIFVVVGFMKEAFEYLIDEYGIELIVNSDYSTKNNLHSLALAADKISNSYIVPVDIWSEENPFQRNELSSWYMVSDSVDDDSEVRINRKNELVRLPGERSGNSMIGIAYINHIDSPIIRKRLYEYDNNQLLNHSFWEEVLYCKGKMMVPARVISSKAIVEINTYEQLREIDEDSNQLKSDAMVLITQVLNCSLSDIQNVEVLKKGMTNRSFVFSCFGEKYIMRIPGAGTDELVNRKQEVAVYHAIRGRQLCDDPIYLNGETGYKITKFIPEVRVCNPDSTADLRLCMRKLRSFHEMNIAVDHSFDLFGMIDFYESLWDGAKSSYRDYEKTKQNILSLKNFVDKNHLPYVLTHIDAVPDNFLFSPKLEGELSLQLTDWEYAGMQDPHVDIAMFCIYSLYNKQQIDKLITLYFDGEIDATTKIKIYCYIAICGLLWSNWCEYKRILGTDFGEYSLKQYRYAKDYFSIAHEEMSVLENE